MSTGTRVALVLALSVAPALAFGQDRAAAREHFERAERNYATGNWETALAEYTAAYDAAPMPEFLFNMAQCHRELGHPTDALELYQRFLTEKPDAPNRATVEGLIDEMRREIAAAQPTPPAAAPADTEAPPAATAPGEPAPSPPTEPADDGDGSALSRIRVLTWAALGGTVVLFGVSGLFALDASDAESDLASRDLNCKARLARCLDLQERGDRSSVLRNTFFVVGLVGLAGTGVLAALDLSRSGADDRVALVVPALSPDGLGLTGVFTW